MFKLVQMSFCTLAVLLIFLIGSAPAQSLATPPGSDSSTTSQTQTPVAPTTRPSTNYSVPNLGSVIPQGTGVAFVNLDSDPRPEMFLMSYQTMRTLDNPSGAKYFLLRIGWNLNASGVAASWLGSPTMVPGVGSEAQGAGMAFANLDSDPRPEMILMAYDNSAGTGTKYFLYKIGWNVSASGVAANWSPVYQVAAVSAEAQGAGVAFVNLDSDPRPEMVLMAYNDVSGTKVFRYKIGWNVGTNGVAASWGSTIQVPGVGSGAYGAGMAFVNLDGNPRPEIILMAYDNSTGTKNLRYKIGWNVSTSGAATSWSPVYQVAGVSPEVQTQGAGMAIVNLDSDPRPEMVMLANEKPQLGVTFCEYMIGRNINTGGVAASWDTVR